MAKEFLAITDDIFTFSETENEKQFYFYRNDRQVLSDIGRKPIEFYHEYMAHKMMSGEITEELVMHNFYTELSTDKKCIRLTICDIGEISKDIDSDENSKDISRDSDADKKEENFLKRLFHKIFG